MSNSITMKLAYNATDETRQIKIDDVADSVLAGVQTNIEAINASLSASTSGGMNTFFVSNSGAELVSIQSATIESVIETPITIIES